MTTGDVTRPRRVTTDGVCTEEYDYDAEGRLIKKTLTMIGRPDYPYTIDYAYDSLNRLVDITYPAEYGIAGTPRKLMHHDFSLANKLGSLKVDGLDYVSQIEYNVANQMTSLKVGKPGKDQITEKYMFDPVTGLLGRQQVLSEKSGSLLDLSYDYLRSQLLGRGGPGRTGQITEVINNLVKLKDRDYRYDALGRLVEVAFSLPPRSISDPRTFWTHEYGYDSYGNRTLVKAFGPAPERPELPPSNRDGLDAISYDMTTNRITTSGFAYDAAGNLTSGLRADGIQQKYYYDAAGRLTTISFSSSSITTTVVHNYYGAGRQRLISDEGSITSFPGSNPGRSGHGIWRPYATTYYVWSGDQVLVEYSEPDAPSPSQKKPQWAKSYIYMGERLLATLTPGGAGEVVQYYHPGRLGTRLVTNGVDTTVLEQDPFSFGVEEGSVSTGGNNQRFTSYDRSATTGLDYAVNRHYDPRQGRFTQVDPLGMGGESE